VLTLTRKVGETIRIGDEIQIVVKEIRKNQVRIGIVAPRNVKIFREEVYVNIVTENEDAATAELSDLDDVEIDLPPVRAEAKTRPGRPRRVVSDPDPDQEEGSDD
jgi:carbon storage regulator